VNEAPVPPSARTRAPIPAALDATIMSCLAKAPEDRPASAMELSRRLAACELPRAWTAERSDAWWREHGTGSSP
jgi:hypothetical protein